MSDDLMPERIWIKPCSPCDLPDEYYVCDPRYLDGRGTSYVKSDLRCAGCNGGLYRCGNTMICRDCGKAEEWPDAMGRADEITRLRAEVERLTAALSDERAHADVLAEVVEMFATDRNWQQGGPFDPCSPSFTGTSMASAVAKQHRARRQG